MSDAPTTPITDQQAQIQEVQAEAKRTFSLKDRLAGGKRRRDKVTVFLDEDGLSEMADIKRQITATEARLAAGDESDAGRQATEQTLADLQAKLAPVRADVLASTITVYLVAQPDVAVKIVRRDARTVATNQDGVVDDDRFNEAFTRGLVKKAIVKISDSSGAEADLSEVDDFLESLGTLQLQAINAATSNLMFENNVALATTDEPGF